MQTVKKLDLKSVANVYGAFLALSAFLTGLGIAAVNIANRIIEGGAGFGAIIFVILFNILYGILIGLISAVAGAVIGYITGWIFAWLYNVCVRIKFIGGIKIDLS
ncbi:MAG: hypothetical protein WC323_02250 [Patescibacteria group bacterium]|jgi:prepilin signal peptidase PulO-like enzyme (type II secretory pathway)